MPIRFRCAYCNQLLGIARRKAGTVVRCPTCAGQVVVPETEPESGDGGPGDPEALVFERGDFEDLLKPEPKAAVPVQQTAGGSSEAIVALPPLTKPPPGAWGTHAEPDVERINPLIPAVAAPSGVAPQPGIWLSPAKATLLAVVAALAIAFAFGAGVLVGYFLRPAEASSTSQVVPAERLSAK